MVAVSIDEALCKGCGLCVAFCKERGLELSPTPNSRGVYVARAMVGVVCCGCRHCVVVCPEAAVTLRQL